jgi:ASCH domain
MAELTELPPALSIKQPWIDLIFRGLKDIEVREWRVARRGPILIHASNTIDWKTAELLGYDTATDLPRGGLVGIAMIVDVIEFSRQHWLDLMPRHRVIHPPVREPVYGVVLDGVIPFRTRIACRGRRMLFPVPVLVESRTRAELAALGLTG